VHILVDPLFQIPYSSRSLISDPLFWIPYANRYVYILKTISFRKSPFLLSYMRICLERNPPPLRAGFLFPMFPDQDPEGRVRVPPKKGTPHSNYEYPQKRVLRIVRVLQIVPQKKGSPHSNYEYTQKRVLHIVWVLLIVPPKKGTPHSTQKRVLHIVTMSTPKKGYSTKYPKKGAPHSKSTPNKGYST